MQLKIITPENVVLDETVEAVYAVSSDGEVGILPGHIPLATPLNISVLRYVQNGQKHPLAVMGGLLYTNGKLVSVLCQAAELSQNIDAVRAEHAKQRAEKVLSQETDALERNKAEIALTRALMRLKATKLV